MLATSEAGAVADRAEDRKRLKYADVLATHHFVPVAVETSGVFGHLPSVRSILSQFVCSVVVACNNHCHWLDTHTSSTGTATQSHVYLAWPDGLTMGWLTALTAT